MSKLYSPNAIINKLFNEGTEVSQINVQILETGENITFENITTESLVGDDNSNGQYAMVKGTPQQDNKTKGLKITPKTNNNGDIIDIYVSGNVANPYIFNKQKVVLTSLTQ